MIFGISRTVIQALWIVMVHVLHILKMLLAYVSENHTITLQPYILCPRNDNFEDSNIEGESSRYSFEHSEFLTLYHVVYHAISFIYTCNMASLPILPLWLVVICDWRSFRQIHALHDILGFITGAMILMRNRAETITTTYWWFELLNSGPLQQAI